MQKLFDRNYKELCHICTIQYTNYKTYFFNLSHPLEQLSIIVISKQTVSGPQYRNTCYSPSTNCAVVHRNIEQFFSYNLQSNGAQCFCFHNASHVNLCLKVLRLSVQREQKFMHFLNKYLQPTVSIYLMNFYV